MPNPYFNNQRTFIPNTLVKSDEVNSQFNDVENGFDLIDEKFTQVEQVANDSVTTINNTVTEVVQLIDQVQEIIDNGSGDQPGTVPGAPVLIPFNQAIPFDGNYIMQTTDADIRLNFSVDTSKPPVIGAKVRLTMIGRGRFDEVLFTGIELAYNGYREPFFHQWGVKNVMTFEYDGHSYTCRLEKGVNDFGGDTYAGTDSSFVVFSQRQGMYSAPANRFLYAIKDHRFIDTPLPQTAYLEGTSYEWPLNDNERIASAKPDDSVAIRNGRNVGRTEICYLTGSQHSLTPGSRIEWSISTLSGANPDTPPVIVFSVGQFDTYLFTPDNPVTALKERIYIDSPVLFFAVNASYTSDLFFGGTTIDYDFDGRQTSASGASATLGIFNVGLGNVAGVYRHNDNFIYAYTRSLQTGQVLRQVKGIQATAELWPHFALPALQSTQNYPTIPVDGGLDFMQKLPGQPPGLVL